MNRKFIFLIIPMIFMLLFLIILCSYSIPILSKYEIKLLDNIKLSFYLALKTPIKTLLNLVIIALSAYIFLYISNIIGLFVFSLSSYILMKNMASCFLFIESKYLK